MEETYEQYTGEAVDRKVSQEQGREETAYSALRKAAYCTIPASPLRNPKQWRDVGSITYMYTVQAIYPRLRWCALQNPEFLSQGS